MTALAEGDTVSVLFSLFAQANNNLPLFSVFPNHIDSQNMFFWTQQQPELLEVGIGAKTYRIGSTVQKGAQKC